MKPVRFCLLLPALLSGLALLQAQTADEIITKHIDAIGGKEKLSAINSVRMENSLSFAGGESSGYVVILNGKGMRNESDFNGEKVVQVYTDKSGWTINPFVGVSEPQAMADPQYKSGVDQIYIVPFLNYAARGDKAELVGRENVGSVNAYKVKVTSKDNMSVTYFFDPTTYYVIKTVRPVDMGGQTVDLVTTFSGHKKTDYGWVTAETMDLDFGGQFSMTTKVKKAEVNAPVDAAMFEMKK